MSFLKKALPILALSLLLSACAQQQALPPEAEPLASAEPTGTLSAVLEENTPLPSPAVETPAEDPEELPTETAEADTPLPAPEAEAPEEEPEELPAETPEPIVPGYSSGDEELDRQLKAVLDELLTDDQSFEDQLHTLYRYVRDNYRYRKGAHYEMGDSSWAAEEAKTMLADGRGNCYSFAALLCELFRADGLDARVYSGTICDSPHGWVEAEIDGTTYIFDVETEWASLQKNYKPDKYEDMFMKTYEQMARWRYERG